MQHEATEEEDKAPVERKSLKSRISGNVWFRIGRNKYLLVTVFFIFWMMFFDNNNWFYLSRLTEEAENKTRERAYYHKEIEEAERQLNELTSDMSALEKFGRESYFMKKDDEDIYVLVPSE